MLDDIKDLSLTKFVPMIENMLSKEQKITLLIEADFTSSFQISLTRSPSLFGLKQEIADKLSLKPEILSLKTNLRPLSKENLSLVDYDINNG